MWRFNSINHDIKWSVNVITIIVNSRFLDTESAFIFSHLIFHKPHTEISKPYKIKIKLYLPFSDWFGTKRTYVWFQINLKVVNTIWFKFDLIRFTCVYEHAHRNLIKSARNQIVFTIVRFIWIQTEVRLDSNQLENGKYNQICVWFITSERSERSSY